MTGCAANRPPSVGRELVPGIGSPGSGDCKEAGLIHIKRSAVGSAVEKHDCLRSEDRSAERRGADLP